MSDKTGAAAGRYDQGLDREEIERVNARLRHFRGVAASVMTDALRLWTEIWDAFQDQRSCVDILEAEKGTQDGPLTGERMGPILEKLHILGMYLDYARRLCEGEIEKGERDER